MAISETDPLHKANLGRKPFDMSLRLWSNDHPLESVVAQMGLAFDHLHIRGQPIQVGDTVSGRTAARHYVSIASAKADQASDVSEWLSRLIEVLKPHRHLIQLIQAGDIEALIWIAIFSTDFRLAFDDDMLSVLRNLSINLMIEGYDQFGNDGAPLREFVTR